MSLKAGLLAEAAPIATSRPASPQRERSAAPLDGGAAPLDGGAAPLDGGAASIDEGTVCPVSLDHDAQPQPPARFPDGPPLRRAPSIEGIEHRAVSAAFLRRFTSSRVTADRSLARRCKKEGVKFLKDRIKELEEEHAALQARMQRSVVTGSLSRGLSAETLGSDDKLAQLERRLAQFKFDLSERKARDYMTTRDVHREIVKVETDERCCRYVEQPDWLDAEDDGTGVPLVGTADYFVSHSWDSPWESVVAACVEHSDAQPEDAKPYLLRQIFCLILSPFLSTDLFGGAGTTGSTSSPSISTGRTASIAAPDPVHSTSASGASI
eukprot:COSAG04_NODE_938_length_9314_cov_3.854287_2_plen_324_part_00